MTWLSNYVGKQEFGRNYKNVGKFMFAKPLSYKIDFKKLRMVGIINIASGMC